MDTLARDVMARLAGRPLVLASASPRRHELLGRTGLDFEIEPADADETINVDLGAGAIAEDLALRKARIVASRRGGVAAPGASDPAASGSAASESAASESAASHSAAPGSAVSDSPGPGSRGPVVLGSDTVVVLGDDDDPGRRFLEKAADGAEARGMLKALSGTRHRVITGVAVVVGGSSPPVELSDHETTWVTMRPITDAEIDAYVASGEWKGKAGAYAIQETADRFVDGLDGGGFDNVVGLPVERTLKLLGRLP